MLITASDCVKVGYAPKAVWAKLTRGPEAEEAPVCRLIDRVHCNETKARFREWVGERLVGGIRDLGPLFNLSWPEANECYESAAREALNEGYMVFGSHYRRGDCVAFPDVLVPEPGGRVSLIAVEMTTEPNSDEAALKNLFNKAVLEKNGFEVSGIRVFQLNPDYVEGESARAALFQEMDIDAKLSQYAPEIETRLETLEELKHQSDPPTRLDEYCPRVDDARLPADHVFLLKQGAQRAAKALAAGITALKDIPLDETITNNHRIQIESAQSGQRHIDKERLSAIIGKLQYPVQSLDFETLSTPIPLFQNCRPYQNIPFEFSLHTREEPGQSLVRAHFLHRAATDPRPELLKALRAALRPEGSILVYNKGCEENVLKELGRDFPEFQRFSEQIIPHLVDLYDVFRGFMMYDPAQRGKTRFKKVLECFAGKSYDGLEIKNGEAATYEYQRVTHRPLGPVTEEDRDAVYRRLEMYCDQDSWGQHDLLEVAEKFSGARIANARVSGLAQERYLAPSRENMLALP
jgi:hypothetical protein